MHRLDPRAKLAAAFGFSLVAATAPTWQAPSLGLILGLVCVALSGMGWKRFLARAMLVNVFVVFLWVFMPYSLGWADGWFTLAPNPAGKAAALLITIKVNAIFAATFSLFATSRVNEIFHALSHFRAPKKLVALLLLFHRYVYVIFQEYKRLTTAMRMRCFRPGNNLHTYRSLASLAAVLLVRSYDRAERVHQAMLCRGFSGTFWVLDHFTWTGRDTAFSFFWGFMVAAMICLAWGGVLWN